MCITKGYRKKENDKGRIIFWFPSYFILHVEITLQPAPSFPENNPTNSSQFDTLKVKYPLLVKYTLTPTQDIVENLVAILAIRLVAILAIRRELKGISDRHPAKVKSLIFLENVANTQFSRIHVFNIYSPLQGCRKDSGNYHWIPDPSSTSPGIDNRQETNAVSVMFVYKFFQDEEF